MRRLIQFTATVQMIRRSIETVLYLAITVITLRTWMVEGLIIAVRVDGPSMATCLLGRHYESACAECGFRFAWDAAQLPARISCPNCGANQQPDGAVTRSGERLVVNRTELSLFNSPRWQLVVFQCPERPREYCVKRIVGLPGETVELCGGDVYVNGKIARKSLPQIRATAISVYDSRFTARGHGAEASRWHADESSKWAVRDTGFRYASARSAAAEPSVPESAQETVPDWLWYDATRGDYFTASGSTGVLDSYGYNQAVSRTLNTVADLFLVLRISASGEGKLLLIAEYGGDNFLLEFVPRDGSGRLFQAGNPVAEFFAGRALLSVPSLLELGLVDGQVTLAVDREVLLQYPLSGRSEIQDCDSLPRSRTATRPLGLGAAGLDVEIEYLQLFRDVYYTDAPESHQPAADRYSLEVDEYFVLGDNSPVSLDSRLGRQHVLRKEFIRGRPFVKR